MRGVRKKTHIQTQTTVLRLSEGRARQVEEGKGEKNGDRKIPEYGWWKHNTIYRLGITEMYTWNLFN